MTDITSVGCNKKAKRKTTFDSTKKEYSSLFGMVFSSGMWFF